MEGAGAAITWLTVIQENEDNLNIFNGTFFLE